MGNTTSEEEPPAITSNSTPDSTYTWPDNLYVETRDMAAASFLVYSFGYILDTARKVGLKGMQVDSHGHATRAESTTRLERTFTPSQVKKLVEDNKEILAKEYPDTFTDPTMLLQTLQVLQDRSQASGMKTPLMLMEYDDYHQDKEMVYAVAKDDINRRITLCFRGTDNQLAKDTNWSTNFNFWKVSAPVPDVIKESVSGDTIWFHGGFYNYIFGQTATETDAPDKRKYDEIMEDVKPLLDANPGYKLYVTGHSLGAAISSIVAFYMACDDSIPKPVTCINFASPRVGDYMYLEASTALEESKKLRVLRIVNDNDSIAMLPMINCYHAGFQIRLYKDPIYPPEITYPKLVDSYWNKFSRMWGNSLITSFNLEYDHGDYRERVDQSKAALEKLDLNALYGRPELTGFSWMEV